MTSLIVKHKKRGRKLGRKKDQRKALLRSLAASLILKGKITTTEAKAKELRPFIEKLVTKGKKNDLSTVRYLARHLPVSARKRLIDEIGPRFQSRPGGYTRIIRLAPRQTDGARMAIIEFVE